MPRMSRATLGLTISMALAACTPSGIDMNTQSSASSPTSEPAQKATHRHNPDPKQAYRITMTIKDAPGPFEWMRPIAHYDVTNRECLSPPRDNPGGRSAPVPTAPTDFEMKQTGDGVYTGVVYADLMMDEDYTGNGVCHWEMTSIVVQMKATGAEGDTLFTPAIPGRKLAPGSAEKVYFNKIAYPRLESSRLDQPVSTGQSDRSRFGDSIQDSDLFTVTFEVAGGTQP